MALRSSMLVPSTVTRTLVCINDISKSEISGELYNPYMQESRPFLGVKEFLDVMEDFFEKVGFPQAYCELRNFDERSNVTEKNANQDRIISKYHGDDLYTSHKGTYATFIVQVQFRQNASWQGSVTWCEKEQTITFKSTLGLLRLMDNALESNHGDPSVFSVC